MRKSVLTAGAILCFAVAGSVRAAETNVALNKTVTVVSGAAQIFNPLISPDVITDGVFTPEDTGYHTSTAETEAVEWGTTNGGNVAPDNSNTDTVLQIDLGGNYSIDGAILQGDDNDSYLLQYYNLTTSTWETLTEVPAISSGEGLRTRPDADQTTYADVGPVITDAVRVSTGTTGDSGMAVSEVQLRGSAVVVPLPAAVWGGLGLLGAISLTRLGKRRLA